jgi:hypothetical protein
MLYLPVEVLDLLFVDLGLLEHSLLEGQPFFNQPVVLLLCLLSLLSAQRLLVLLLRLHLVGLFSSAHLLQLDLNKT